MLSNAWAEQKEDNMLTSHNALGHDGGGSGGRSHILSQQTYLICWYWLAESAMSEAEQLGP